MFVFSLKVSPKTLFFSATCAVLLVFAVVAAAVTPVSYRSAGTTVSTVSGETEEQRVAFLKNLGYEVEETAVQVREIRIPDQADDVLLQYNEFLKTAGWDLEPYMGKRVKLYTYRVLNDTDSAATARVYVYRQTIIGGHVSTSEGEKPLTR